MTAERTGTPTRCCHVLPFPEHPLGLIFVRCVEGEIIGKKAITGTFSTSTLCWRKGSGHTKVNNSELSFTMERKCYGWQEEFIQDKA